ncbi:bifunctional alpha,alpha-trehalose-phosphate synthase (UDP-forming)/trehalose-phosphatase [bacterium]|nr:bifunctional alpha,alpha-trehalose-phosphate synthase (UDP-forming)/trehalose-phosphatase [bacterium]
MNGKIICISNRLPIKIEDEISPTSGGLVSALRGVKGSYDMAWIGWAEITSSEMSRDEIAALIQENFNYHPVFLSPREVEEYYFGFSNSTIWPLLHYMSNLMQNEPGWYTTYKQVNETFADAVTAVYEPGDLIWIHDYHLMLLPSMLRHRLPGAKIGFFLHTPFPSFEIWRTHPYRQELLSGLLGADLVGFHTFGYSRHFRSSVMRLLGYEAEINKIIHDHHITHIGVFPIGIDSEAFEETLSTRSYNRQYQRLKKEFRKTKVVLNVERLDYTKGIPRKLQAIELFLEKYPEQRNKVVFIIQVVPSRETIESYQDIREQIELAISRINGKYATTSNTPIHYIYHAIPFEELCALYEISDVAFVAPLRDGMNLVAKEYLACQRNNNGVLVLSEFAGASQELFNALLINPFNTEQVADTLQFALTMDQEDIRERMYPMIKKVYKYDARQWADDFIRSLTVIDGDERLADAPVLFSDDDLRQLAQHESIALFLDYDGTLREFVNQPEKAVPGKKLLKLIRELTDLPGVDVYIISGRKKEFMDKHLSRIGATLISEHGLFYRSPVLKKWQSIKTLVDLSWKEQITEVFNQYALSTPGAFVETKAASVVWHYRSADPEFGQWKASQLLGELYEVVSNLPVQISQGQKIVEISSSEINKGAALAHFISTCRYSRVLCIGDDVTDESMFVLEDPSIISIKVGMGKTRAAFRLPSPQHVRDMLERFIEWKRSPAS